MLGFDALAKLPLASLPGGFDGQVLQPALYTDPDTFYSATVVPGAVTLSPSLYSDADTFYGPTIVQVVFPGLFTDGETFYSPQINQTVFPALLADADVFYSPEVIPGTAFIRPDLFEDQDSFYSPTLTISISPTLFVDQDIFFPLFVGLGTPPVPFPANICMHSGFKTEPGKLARQWNGLWSRHDDFDRRHPQELVRPITDRMGVPVPRPEAEDSFISAGDVTPADL